MTSHPLVKSIIFIQFLFKIVIKTNFVTKLKKNVTFDDADSFVVFLLIFECLNDVPPAPIGRPNVTIF